MSNPPRSIKSNPIITIKSNPTTKSRIPLRHTKDTSDYKSNNLTPDNTDREKLLRMSQDQFDKAIENAFNSGIDSVRRANIIETRDESTQTDNTPNEFQPVTEVSSCRGLQHVTGKAKPFGDNWYRAKVTLACEHHGLTCWVRPMNLQESQIESTCLDKYIHISVKDFKCAPDAKHQWSKVKVSTNCMHKNKVCWQSEL